MNIDTRAVHAGDRKKPGTAIPVTTPIYTAASYIYDETETLDKVFGKELAGDSYARYENPTNRGLEQQLVALEGGAGALACSSGMVAIQYAIQAALLDRRKSIVAASALYGATINLLRNIFENMGVEVIFADFCDPDAVQAAVDEAKPGCLLMETISNPLLRVGPLDKIAEIARKAGAALIVDNTFATPLILRPLELGANIVVHSLTKYLSGHGDVLGGAIISDGEHLETIRAFGRTAGPVLGPFEAYLSMRGIKTYPLRFRRQCENAMHLASWLAGQPRVTNINFPANADHPDRATVQRLFPADLAGAMISFEVKDAGKAEIFAFMDKLRLVVRATSLGDVHTMMLYPAISSHREIAPKQRERMGIRDSLVRLSVGIEAIEDVIADLEQALRC